MTSLISKLTKQCITPCAECCDEGSSKGNQTLVELQEITPTPPQNSQIIPETTPSDGNTGIQSLCPPQSISKRNPTYDEVQQNPLLQPLNQMSSDNIMPNPNTPTEMKVIKSTEIEKRSQENSPKSVENTSFSPLRNTPNPDIKQSLENDNSQDQPENSQAYRLQNLDSQETHSEIQNNILRQEESKDTQQETILSRRDSKRFIKKSPRPRELNPRGLKNPGANECFANALFQVLYNLSEFRDRFKVRESKFPKNDIQNKLCALFGSMENKRSSLDDIQRNKTDLFEKLKNKNPDIVILQSNGGDSRTLFQVLASGICEEQSLDENHIFSLFCTGNIEKAVECPSCKEEGKETVKIFSEKFFMLSAQENLFYSQQEPSNFFQTESELRNCRVCRKRSHHTKKITLETLPKVLAIKIEENSTNFQDFDAKDLHKHLIFSDSQGIKVNYKFFGGVYNTRRGFDGAHSVAYVMESEDGKFVKSYNDSMAKTMSWDNIYGYPKLLFYCQA